MSNTPKFCPILTAAVLSPPSRVIGPAGVQKKDGFDAVPCAGPSCAFFTPIVEAGKAVGGNCAVTLFPSAISMLNETMRTVAAPPTEPTATNL